MRLVSHHFSQGEERNREIRKDKDGGGKKFHRKHY